MVSGDVQGSDVHLLSVADTGHEILCCLNDFIGDFMVRLEEHFHLGVVVVLALLAFGLFGEVHGGEVVVGFEKFFKRVPH